jgi:hypothetical protein
MNEPFGPPACLAEVAIRSPSAAGSFHSGSREKNKSRIDKLFPVDGGRREHGCNRKLSRIAGPVTRRSAAKLRADARAVPSFAIVSRIG